jgi:lysophospholipase L1-like esterase
VAVEAAQAAAEAARDSSFANAKGAATIADARALVADNETFIVYEAGAQEFTAYRRTSSSTQVFLGSYPAARPTRRAMITAGIGVSSRRVTVGTGSITPTILEPVAPTNGVEYEAVAEACAGTLDFIQIIRTSSGLLMNAVFDLRNGTIVSNTTGVASMRYLGGNVWECKVTATATGTTNGNVQVRPSTTGAFPFTADEEYFWLDSFELRVAGVNVWASNDPASSVFTKTDCAVSIDAIPELRLSEEVQSQRVSIGSLDTIVNGQMTGWKLIEDAGTGNPSLFRSRAWVSGQEFYFKAILKKAERSRVNLFSTANAPFNVTCDLENGTVSGAGGSIEYLGNGWYACGVAGTANGTGGSNLQCRIFPSTGGHPYTGDGSSGVFVQEITLSVDGSDNVFTFPTDFSNAVWTKQDCTVTAAQALYLGIRYGMGTSAGGGGADAFAGKKWAALGTSITAQDRYVPVVAGALGLTSENLGVSGASIASGSHYGSLGIYNEIVNIDADTHLVTIEAGTNDFGTDNSDLGALGDTTTATFYGALYAAVVAIRAQAPDARIVFFTPYSGDSRTSTHRHFRTNTKGHTLRQFQKAVEEVAAFLGLPCIDVGQSAGLGYLTLGPYSSDGLHINAAGGAKFGGYVAEQLREMARAGLFL